MMRTSCPPATRRAARTVSAAPTRSDSRSRAVWRIVCVLLAAFVPASVFAGRAARAEESPAAGWTLRDEAVIEGRRWDVPTGYDPVARRFLVLGGRSSFADVRKPRSYDVLAFDPSGRWRNELPAGTDWGPEFGPVAAPVWKDEKWGFRDAAGTVRPNWSVYGTFSLGQKFDYDPDTRAFYFYAGGSTFRYDPAQRTWQDLAPETDPQSALGGILLWSSLCYDRAAKRFVLFGGGNVPTDRGDAGTWIYAPADNTWRRTKSAVEPPARANSRLVSDPERRQVVLFGGDRLDRLVADTWIFDAAKGTWEERRPPVSPAPRAGHALLWLPKSQRVLLLGGYGYTSTVEYVAPLYQPLPLEAWTYDTAADKWELVGRWEPGTTVPAGPANFFLSAAVDEHDTVLLLDSKLRVWTRSFAADRPDPDATRKFGVEPGATSMRTGSHDPAWYRQDVPAPDPAQVAKDLQDLPANRWVLRPTPKRPGMNMDWGSATFDAGRDRIVRFSGGHSAYSGTAPVVYDVQTDRWSLPFAPEYPIEFVYSNDQVRGERSFAGNPWMTGHTYKSTGFDPRLGRLVFAAHDFTYFFDADAGKWSRSAETCPFRPNMYVVTLCPTPEGTIAWADARDGGRQGLWRLDEKTRTWQPLPLTGELPAKSPDRHGLAFDAARNRLVFFSNTGPKAGNVAAYDVASGKAAWLDPAGAERATAACRETAYLPDGDLVLIGGRVETAPGAWSWLAYDVAANAWTALRIDGEDPIGKSRPFNVSLGLMYDPGRKLTWAVGQHSEVHVLRLDAKTIRRAALE